MTPDRLDRTIEHARTRAEHLDRAPAEPRQGGAGAHLFERLADAVAQHLTIAGNAEVFGSTPTGIADALTAVTESAGRLADVHARLVREARS